MNTWAMALAAVLMTAFPVVSTADESHPMHADSLDDIAPPIPPDTPAQPAVFGEKTTFKSGVQITPMKKGAGPLPAPLSTASVHYRAFVKGDGRVFENSYAAGTPVSVSIPTAIPCWREALTQMNKGSKSMVVCPPSTAYGSAGAPPSVPPDATVVFQIELLDFKP